MDATGIQDRGEASAMSIRGVMVRHSPGAGRQGGGLGQKPRDPDAGG